MVVTQVFTLELLNVCTFNIIHFSRCVVYFMIFVKREIILVTSIKAWNADGEGLEAPLGDWSQHPALLCVHIWTPDNSQNGGTRLPGT